MAKDRVFTSSQYRTVIDEMKKNDVLGLNIVEGKDIFMLAVALGLDNPTQLKNRVGLLPLAFLFAVCYHEFNKNLH